MKFSDQSQNPGALIHLCGIYEVAMLGSNVVAPGATAQGEVDLSIGAQV